VENTECEELIRYTEIMVFKVEFISMCESFIDEVLRKAFMETHKPKSANKVAIACRVIFDPVDDEKQHHDNFDHYDEGFTLNTYDKKYTPQRVQANIKRLLEEHPEYPDCKK